MGIEVHTDKPNHICPHYSEWLLCNLKTSQSDFLGFCLVRLHLLKLCGLSFFLFFFFKSAKLFFFIFIFFRVWACCHKKPYSPLCIFQDQLFSQFDWVLSATVIAFSGSFITELLHEQLNEWAQFPSVCVEERVWKMKTDRTDTSRHETVNTFSSEPAGADGVSEKCGSVFYLQ